MPLARSVRIRLSRQTTELIGRPFVELHLPPEATAQDVLASFARHFPASAPLLRSTLVVADDRVLGTHDPIPAQAEIALLHPIAGG